MEGKEPIIISFSEVSFYGNQTHANSLLAPIANKGTVFQTQLHIHIEIFPSCLWVLREE